MRWIAIALTLTTRLLSPQQASALDGFSQNGYGVKSKGIGGAGIAFPQDALGIAANPAAATELGNSFEFDADLVRPIRSATIRGNALAPDAGYNGNGGLETKYDFNPYARFVATGTAGINLGQILFSPTVAYRLTERQSIGLSLNELYQTFSAYGLHSFGALSQDPAAISDRATDNATGIGVRLCYVGRITPWLRVGAMWQSQTVVDSFNRYKGLLSNGGDLNLPSSYRFGVYLTPFTGLERFII